MTNPADGQAIIVFTRAELEAIDWALFVVANTGDYPDGGGPTREVFDTAQAKIESEQKMFETRDRRREENRQKAIDVMNSDRFPIRGVPEGEIDAAVDQVRGQEPDDQS